MYVPERLNDEHITALQQVDLHFGWISHGTLATQYAHGLPYENGPAILGIYDEDYALAHDLLSTMGPGDVLARESAGGATTPTNYDVLSHTTSLLYRSPFVEPPLQNLPAYKVALHNGGLDNAAPEVAQELLGTVEPIEESAQLLRNLHAGTLFEYTDTLAIARGLTRAVADSARDIHERFGDNLTIRDADMAVGLGNIALSMVNTPASALKGRIPLLGFVAGRGHIGVEQILKEHDVPFQSQATREPLRDSIRMMAYGILNPSTLQENATKMWINNWFKNLRAHGFEPKNTELTHMHLR